MSITEYLEEYQRVIDIFRSYHLFAEEEMVSNCDFSQQSDGTIDKVGDEEAYRERMGL